MRLDELLQGIEYTGSAPQDCEITSITDDSRNVKPGCIFVCIKGDRFDGHSVAQQAIDQGAACAVVQYDTGAAPQLLVQNTRQAFALLCANFYGNPARKLILTAVTGTNGKTTVACLLKEIFDAAGYKTGLIGTMKNMVLQEDLPAAVTTPEPWELHALLAKMEQAGCTHVFMEASSQALAQQRLHGLHFKAAAFTNLTQDHLDYHKTFQAYFEAKRMLFFQSDCAVFNLDDDASLPMLEGTSLRRTSYSITNNAADYTAKNVQLMPSGVSYELVSCGQIGRIRFGTPGAFSVYNSMAAACTALELGMPFEQVQLGIAASKGVKGRMEVVPTGTPYTVIIDYAHSPDGLQNVLETLRETTNGRVICVFGCGGDRDPLKRPLMGRIAAKLSDVVIVTSDNPRSEDPNAIIRDVLEGIRGKSQVFTEPDRAKAIALALKKARSGDAVLLAGKGHEDYQVLAEGKVHMDEREIINQCLMLNA